ncbi:MAG: 50S ribosomal protein L11 methyltransferase [Brumimicrobium sp.]
MDYIELTLDITPKQPWTEIIISELAEIDFESFTEDNNLLQAYIPINKINQKELAVKLNQFDESQVKITYQEKHIPSQNWNATWESDYKPVEIDRKLLIRAPFHEVSEDFENVIEIQPQMSFGTGHHETTYLFSKILLSLDLNQKSVLDVGTGTGVLGIIASKKGAESIIGTDIEPRAVKNAIENIERNKIENFKVLEGDIDIVPDKTFDFIFANINKNVLKNHLPKYAKRSNDSSTLLLSGFFESDIDELIDAAKLVGFKHNKTHTLDTWAVLEFKR